MYSDIISLFKIMGSKWQNSLFFMIIISMCVAFIDTIAIVIFALSNVENKNEIFQIEVSVEIIAILFVMISALARGALNYFQIRFSFFSAVTLGKIIFNLYLNCIRSDKYLITDNKVISTITTRLSAISGNILLAGLQIINFLLFTFFLISSLVFFKIYEVLLPLLVLMATFAFIYLLMKPIIQALGIKINIANTKIVEMLNETTQVWQLIRLRMQEKNVSNSYAALETNFRKDMATVGFLSTLPRYGVEILLAVSLGLIILVNNNDNLNLIDIIIFGYAALRTLPMVQQGYNGMTLMASGQAGLREVSGLISDFHEQEESFNQRQTAVDDLKSIEICNLSSERIHGSLQRPINVLINQGEKIAIVGASGSGKSTLLDSLMGLIKVDDRKIFFNKKCINTINLASVYKQIAYLPQVAPLINGTVEENILNGIDGNYDRNLFYELLALMELATSCKEDDHTFLSRQVGDRGKNLSGGQRQRIQLINTLILNKKILILDEATSALDKKIEENIINYALSQDNLTVILITHNEQIKARFNKIIELK